MAHESFEDADVAAVMNAAFVNIKVDREERPDLDEIYMRAVQSFTGGRGGWPMTVFLTPAGEPFYGGTYFPPKAKGGLPGFTEVLQNIDRLWREERGRVASLAPKLTAMLSATGQVSAGEGDLAHDWLERVAVGVQSSFDAKNGGFGGAPKFPPHGTLAVLLAHAWATGSSRSIGMATATLDGMAKGGMYDHLAGGFARYSVDATWRIPHFEKMLYDNAQLIPVYLDSWRLTGNPHHARVVRETIQWALTEMLLPDGGFTASTDADSEYGENLKGEGRYFVWTPGELATALGPKAGARVAELCGVTEAGTFEDGTSVLRLDIPLEGQNADDRALLERSFAMLGKIRGRRPAPGRDDKVVTSWNALLLGGMARAGAAMREPAWVESAAEAARFLLGTLTVDGRLMRSWKDGRASHPAFADDHAALVGALVDLYEATGELHWLDSAINLADRMIALFGDGGHGTLWYTGSDTPALIVRSKHLIGGAEPSANGLAAHALVRLWALTGREDYRSRAEAICLAYQQWLTRAPRALGYEALAGAWLTDGGQQVAITGPARRPLVEEYHATYNPFAVLAAFDAPPGTLPWTAGKEAHDGALAFVCTGWTCKAPTADPAVLGALLIREPQEEGPRLDGVLLTDRQPLPLPTSGWIGEPPAPGQVVVLAVVRPSRLASSHLLAELAGVEAEAAVVVVIAPRLPYELQFAADAIAPLDLPYPVVVDRAWASRLPVEDAPGVLVLDPAGRLAWHAAGEIAREDLLTVVRTVRGDAPARRPVARGRVEIAGRFRFPARVSCYVPPPLPDRERDPLDGAARLYVSDTGNHRVVEAVVRRGPDGWPVAKLLRTFGVGQPGLVDGEGRVARFRSPQGTSRLGDTLWVADAGNHAIRAIDLRQGDVGTAVGTGGLGDGAPLDPQDPLGAALRSPHDVVATGTPGETAVFVAMTGSNQIWLYLDAQRTIAPFAGSGAEEHVDGELPRSAMAEPVSLALSGRFLFFVDQLTHSVRAVDLQERQVVTAVGRGADDFGDSGAPDIRLQRPMGLAVAGMTAYIADSWNHKIKRLEVATGEITTLAGPDGLREPGGIALCGDWLFVADTLLHRIRVMQRNTGEMRDLQWV